MCFFPQSSEVEVFPVYQEMDLQQSAPYELSRQSCIFSPCWTPVFNYELTLTYFSACCHSFAFLRAIFHLITYRLKSGICVCMCVFSFLYTFDLLNLVFFFLTRTNMMGTTKEYKVHPSRVVLVYGHNK